MERAKDTLHWISGQDADAGRLDDNGQSVWRVEGGPHDGHTVTFTTAKHNCGAYAVDIDCNCGAGWSNAMNGCWQVGHQREEAGDETLAEMNTLAYDREGMPDEEDAETFKFEDGCGVKVGEYIVVLTHEGQVVANSNVDYYYDAERGYGCATSSAVARQYHKNFCPLAAGMNDFDFRGSTAGGRQCTRRQEGSPHPPHRTGWYQTVRFGALDNYCLGLQGPTEDGILHIEVRGHVGDAAWPSHHAGRWWVEREAPSEDASLHS